MQPRVIYINSHRSCSVLLEITNENGDMHYINLTSNIKIEDLLNIEPFLEENSGWNEQIYFIDKNILKMPCFISQVRRIDKNR